MAHRRCEVQSSLSASDRSTRFCTNPQFRLGPTRPTDPLRAQRDANFGSGPLDRPTLSTARMAVGSKFECVFCYSDCNWVGPTRPTDPLGPQTMGRTDSIDRLTLDPDLNRLTNFALRTAMQVVDINKYQKHRALAEARFRFTQLPKWI